MSRTQPRISIGDASPPERWACLAIRSHQTCFFSVRPGDNSALARACIRAIEDNGRRLVAEQQADARDQAISRMQEWNAHSPQDVIRILEDRSQSADRRAQAASALGALRCRQAVQPLVDALGEGDTNLSWNSANALIDIGSRPKRRRLVQVVKGDYPAATRQAAIYTIWTIEETETRYDAARRSRRLPATCLIPQLAYATRRSAR